MRDVEVTPANTPDTDLYDRLAGRAEGGVYADRAYDKHSRHDDLALRGLADGLMRRGNKHHSLPEREQARNLEISKLRMPAEGVFGYLKRVLGWRRARYDGLAKNEFEVLIKSTAWNLTPRRQHARQPRGAADVGPGLGRATTRSVPERRQTPSNPGETPRKRQIRPERSHARQTYRLRRQTADVAQRTRSRGKCPKGKGGSIECRSRESGNPKVGRNCVVRLFRAADRVISLPSLRGVKRVPAKQAVLPLRFAFSRCQAYSYKRSITMKMRPRVASR